MKSFVAISVIFLLMIAVIASNAVYMNEAVDDFIVTLQFVDESENIDSMTKLEGLQIKWEKEKNYIQASVSHKKIDTINDLLISLLIYKRYGNQEEYEKTAELLRVAFEELRLLEEFSAVNIF